MAGLPVFDYDCMHVMLDEENHSMTLSIGSVIRLGDRDLPYWPATFGFDLRFKLSCISKAVRCGVDRLWI